MVSSHLILIHHQQRQRRVQLADIEAEATAKREEETKRLQEITKAAQAEEQKGVFIWYPYYMLQDHDSYIYIYI